MRFALMTEPQQGYSYQDILDTALAAERLGFETFFRSDHYSSFPGEPDLPTTDAWTTLAGLARETTRIGLGTMVSPVTFRIPGSLAKVISTVDEMSGGRVEMGVGAGWNEPEHARLGIPYPDTVGRVDRMEEELAILRGLWDEPDGWSFEGRPLPGARLAPAAQGSPAQPHHRRHRQAALHPARRPLCRRVQRQLVHTGPGARRRWPDSTRPARPSGATRASLARSVMAGTLVGRDDADMARRTEAQVAIFGDAGDAGGGLARRPPRPLDPGHAGRGSRPHRRVR